MLVRTTRFSTSALSGRSFSLSYVIAGTNDEVHIETYTSPKRFQDTFQGFRFTNPNTGYTFKPEDLPEQHKDPTVVYVAKHPFLLARMDNFDHNQVTDKAFEAKACAALERHWHLRPIQRRIANNHDSKREGAWRILTDDKGRDVAEWEGIWECDDGRIFFLEAKHQMSVDKLHQIREKLKRSLRFLGLEPAKCSVYLAANLWHPLATELAQSSVLNFGVILSNGKELDVLDPSPVPGTSPSSGVVS